MCDHVIKCFSGTVKKKKKNVTPRKLLNGSHKRGCNDIFYTISRENRLTTCTFRVYFNLIYME